MQCVNRAFSILHGNWALKRISTAFLTGKRLGWAIGNAAFVEPHRVPYVSLTFGDSKTAASSSCDEKKRVLLYVESGLFCFQPEPTQRTVSSSSMLSFSRAYAYVFPSRDAAEQQASPRLAATESIAGDEDSSSCSSSKQLATRTGASTACARSASEPAETVDVYFAPFQLASILASSLLPELKVNAQGDIVSIPPSSTDTSSPQTSEVVPINSETFFHRLQLHDLESTAAEHFCGNDVYRGTCLIGENTFETNWKVEGPSKNYTLQTLYMRARAPIDWSVATVGRVDPETLNISSEPVEPNFPPPSSSGRL